MQIAVVMPSRGLTLRDGMEAVDRELRGVKHDFFRTHDLSIPECCNQPVAEAMCGAYTHVLFVEEDIVPPVGALGRLLDEDADIVGMDYELHIPNPAVSHWIFQDHVFWVALGFTLVRRRVFESIPRPWFDVEHSPVMVHSGSASTWQLALHKRQAPYIYGGHDIVFCAKAVLAGMKIVAVSDVRCDHRYLDSHLMDVFTWQK